MPPEPTLSIVIPAYHEADSVAETLTALRDAFRAPTGASLLEILVVDDGSRDGTAEAARAAGADEVIVHARNRGKGAALETGLAQARGDLVLLLDADLRGTASEAVKLLDPVLVGKADVTVAGFPRTGSKSGFGMAQGLSRWGIRRLTGVSVEFPLSGQRLLSRATLGSLGRLASGYGIETAMTLDLLRAGYRIAEVPTAMAHRKTGRDWAGFKHRGKQLWAIARVLLSRAVRPLRPRRNPGS
ncbi:MAG TPA: glycosyltransferase family 2 protein [Armatimonadota bacterium]|jgi:glycosyltransferase involved in cell wall biosynthesis